jgi:phage shock protein C
METNKRLYRDSQNKLIGGVCSGLGAYFNVDFSIIRIIWLLLFLFGGIGLLAYIIAWIVIPEKPQV